MYLLLGSFEGSCQTTGVAGKGALVGSSAEGEAARDRREGRLWWPCSMPHQAHSTLVMPAFPRWCLQIVNPGVGEGGQALEACLTPDGQYVLSGNPDCSIRAWRVQVGMRCCHTL